MMINSARVNIARMIMRLDQNISRQVNAIIAHEQFQCLEARWRNLVYLTTQARHKKSIKIFILSLNQSEFFHDLLQAMDFDQSQLFEKIYHHGFGMAGGEPFNILIGDYAFSNTPKDIQVLQLMSHIASAAFSPFIAGASAQLLGMNQFADLGRLPDIATVFQQQEYRLWKNLRTEQAMKFIALVLPQHLVRLPYSITSAKTFQYHASCTASDYLWGNAAFSFAAVVMRCFDQTGWFANIRGVHDEHYEGGGSVPAYVNPEDSARSSPLLTTDVFITDNQEKELSDLGFIPLCQQYPGGDNVFYSNCSVQQVPVITDDQQFISVKASSLLQYLLCACRFAHYLKVIMRDKLGSFLSAEECESTLNDWLLRYVAGNEDLGIAKRALFPLQMGLVKVRSSAKTPGAYYCQIHLKPFFQLEQLHAEFLFTTSMVVSSLQNTA